jgi:uncharacterized glyoxalase superfamily protein PhnB
MNDWTRANKTVEQQEEHAMGLARVTPILRIFDEAKAREFYVDFLCFSIDWEHRFSEGAPLYMQVSKDGCVLHLSEHYGDCCPGAAMRIQTDELEQYCQQLQAKHHKYGWPAINETPWGSRDMGIKDPFGNRLVFTNAIST